MTKVVMAGLALPCHAEFLMAFSLSARPTGARQKKLLGARCCPRRAVIGSAEIRLLKVAARGARAASLE